MHDTGIVRRGMRSLGKSCGPEYSSVGGIKNQYRYEQVIVMPGGRLHKVRQRWSLRISPMVDRSRDLSLVRGGRTRLSSANPRAEAAQDLLVAPRLLVLSAE